MYIPKYYRNEDPDSIRAFIKENGFAIIVNEVDNRPWATHIPLILLKKEDGREVLSGHISRGNKQWRSFTNEKEVLAIFHGPHSYISSSWYDHENVPTWNYLAIHIYGKIRIIEGEDLIHQLTVMVDKYEAGIPNRIAVSTMSQKFLNDEIKGIVGFEVEITDIQATKKLSQNRDDKNYKAIINELENTKDRHSLEISKLMVDERS